MRFIRLDEDSLVVSERIGNEIVIGEIESDIGFCGQKMLPDGTFIDVEVISTPQEQTAEERISKLETENKQLFDTILWIMSVPTTTT